MLTFLFQAARCGNGRNEFWHYAQRQRETGCLCDVSLSACDGRGDATHFSAHMLLLAASCRYFRQVVEQPVDSLGDVYHLDGVDVSDLRLVLDCIYHQVDWSAISTNATARDVAQNLGMIQVISSRSDTCPKVSCNKKNSRNKSPRLYLSGTEMSAANVPNLVQVNETADKDASTSAHDGRAMGSAGNDNAGGLYICTLCCPQKRFINSTGLRNHTLWKHGSSSSAQQEPKDVYSCELCGVQVRAYSALTIHFRKRHSMVKMHQCEYCSEAFNKLRTLLSHMAAVHDRAAFSCSDCELCFKSREGWRIHMQKQHSTSKFIFMTEGAL